MTSLELLSDVIISCQRLQIGGIPVWHAQLGSNVFRLATVLYSTYHESIALVRRDFSEKLPGRVVVLVV